MDMEKQMQLIKAGNFKENNGSVMRTINMLRHKYHKLKSVKYALPDISEGEVLDSVNYQTKNAGILMHGSQTV